MDKKIIDILILNGRPAAGKSEIIDFLKKTPLEERIEKYHVGEFIEIDDFAFLWEQFEDDDLLEEMGKERTLTEKTFTYKGETHPGYSFKENWYWNFLIKKIEFTCNKIMKEHSDFSKSGKTVFIEFARGSEHGGFEEAYKYLSSDLLKKAGTLYIDVTWDESLRKNRRRFNPDKPDSILEHGLEDLKMEKLYKESDWAEFSSKDRDFLISEDRKVPFAVFNNMPEKTDDPAKIEPELTKAMTKIWENYYKA